MPRNPTRSLWFLITLDRFSQISNYLWKRPVNFPRNVSSENKSKTKRPLPTARRCSPWKSCPPGLASCSWTPQQSISASTQIKDSQWNSGECLVIWLDDFVSPIFQRNLRYWIFIGNCNSFLQHLGNIPQNLWTTFHAEYLKQVLDLRNCLFLQCHLMGTPVSLELMWTQRWVAVAYG